MIINRVVKWKIGGRSKQNILVLQTYLESILESVLESILESDSNESV